MTPLLPKETVLLVLRDAIPDAEWLLRHIESQEGWFRFSTETLSHLSGKHLFRCLARYIKACLVVDLDDLDPLGLYLRVLGKLDLVALKPLRDKILGCHPGLVQAQGRAKRQSIDGVISRESRGIDFFLMMPSNCHMRQPSV